MLDDCRQTKPIVVLLPANITEFAVDTVSTVTKFAVPDDVPIVIPFVNITARMKINFKPTNDAEGGGRYTAPFPVVSND